MASGGDAVPVDKTQEVAETLLNDGASAAADTSALPIEAVLKAHSAALAQRKEAAAKRDAELRAVAISATDVTELAADLELPVALITRVLQEEGGDRAAAARRLISGRP